MKRDMQKISFRLRPNSLFHVNRAIFDKFFKNMLWSKTKLLEELMKVSFHPMKSKKSSLVLSSKKGDRSFTSTQAEISAYLGLNILIGIHELPQLAMYWDSDEFVGVDCLKKTIPEHRFMTLGKYLHRADPTAEDQNHSPLQSLPPCNSLGAKVCRSEEHICIVQSETFHLGVKIGLFLLMTRKK